MACGNNQCNNETDLINNRGNGRIIVIVLYILLAIILSSLFVY